MMKKAGDLQTDARAAVVRLKADGSVRRTSAVGATPVRLDGEKLPVTD